ncbi:MAG: LysR family transcriptional regulator [Acidobacteriota bacterium]|nr:LysR family transcriptional regulator [Acidobacteriota bacterium]
MRQLDAIARRGTISAAAEELHLSQPALSRSIRRLERELGQDLFDRTHNSAQLNKAGRLAVDHARMFLRDERAMRDAFADLSRRQRTLLVGTVAPAPVWRITALTVERFPGTLLNPVLLPEDEVERRLMNREIDLAVTLHPMILPTMGSVRLMTEDLYAFLPKDHCLASRSSLSFADMDGEDFLVLSQVGFWMDMLHRNMAHAQIVEQADRVVFEHLVRTTRLISFVTNITRQDRREIDRIAVPITDADAHVTFYLSALEDAPERVTEIFGWVRCLVEA